MARTARTKAVSPSDREQVLGMVRRLLEGTAGVLVEMGCPPSTLAREFSQICRRRRARPLRLTSTLAPLVSGLGDLLTQWHTDPRLLTENGEPRALTFSGGGRSLSALIKRAVPGQNPQRVLRTLVRTQSIRRRGLRYVPVRRFFSTAEISPLAHVQSLGSMCGLLHTVQHNVTCEDPMRRRLERRASSSWIPVKHAPEVHRFLKAENHALLERADSFMGRFKASDVREPAVRIHLVTFVHEEPRPLNTRSRRTRSMRPPRTRR